MDECCPKGRNVVGGLLGHARFSHWYFCHHRHCASANAKHSIPLGPVLWISAGSLLEKEEEIVSKIFVCSDTHFGHFNIIKYCDRPFASAEEMDEAMITRWNSRVTNDDTVYFLGDFAFAPEWRIKQIFEQLNFHLCLIVPGNHDKTLLKMWAHPFETFIPRVRIIDPLVQIEHESKKFVMCHYPMAEWDGFHRGSIHLHGHCHGSKTKKHPTPKMANRYDIGVDMYGGPVQITGDLRFLNDPKGWL